MGAPEQSLLAAALEAMQSTRPSHASGIKAASITIIRLFRAGERNLQVLIAAGQKAKASPWLAARNAPENNGRQAEPPVWALRR